MWKPFRRERQAVTDTADDVREMAQSAHDGFFALLTLIALVVIVSALAERRT